MPPYGGTVRFFVMRYLVIPSVVVVMSSAIIYAALHIELSPPMIVGHSLQPRVFPIFLMIINIMLAITLAVHLRKTPDKERAPASLRMWGSIILFFLFYGLTTYFDILIGLAVVSALMCLLWGERRYWVALAVGIITPSFIFFLFNWVLGIRFPRGMITNLFYG